MSGSEYLLWSYGQFEKMTFFPPDPLVLSSFSVSQGTLFVSLLLEDTAQLWACVSPYNYQVLECFLICQNNSKWVIVSMVLGPDGHLIRSVVISLTKKRGGGNIDGDMSLLVGGERGAYQRIQRGRRASSVPKEQIIRDTVLP